MPRRRPLRHSAGKFDNPDVSTLELTSAARKDDKFTLHLTNPPEAFVKPAVGKAVKKKYKVATRAAKDLSVQVALLLNRAAAVSERG